MDSDYALVLASYIKSSQYRFKVAESLMGSVMTPTEISNDTGILVAHMSNVLKQLKSKDIIECINEDARKGRLYRLTDTGNLVVNEYLPLLLI